MQGCNAFSLSVFVDAAAADLPNQRVNGRHAGRHGGNLAHQLRDVLRQLFDHIPEQAAVDGKLIGQKGVDALVRIEGERRDVAALRCV